MDEVDGKKHSPFQKIAPMEHFACSKIALREHFVILKTAHRKHFFKFILVIHGFIVFLPHTKNMLI